MEITAVKELLPTEGLLLLDVHGTTGRQLLVKTIEELILLGAIQIDIKEFGTQRTVFIREKKITNRHLNEYHELFLLSIREHYYAYNEVTAKNALTPNKLIGSVQFKLNFSDKKYKFKYVFERLKVRGLVKSRFPFYYLKNALTKKGGQLRQELKTLIDNLDQEMNVGDNKSRLVELSDKIGLNVILLPGVFKQLGQIKFDGPKYFEGPELEIHNSFIEWEILDSANLPMTELFDLPDNDD